MLGKKVSSMEFMTIVENQPQIVIGIVGVCGTVVWLLCRAIPKFFASNVPVQEVINVASAGVKGADEVVEALQVIYPQSSALELADKVIGYAEIAVKRAEQLLHINLITPSDRKGEAIQYVKEILMANQVQITPQIERIIDGAIEAAVLGMGHHQNAIALNENNGY